MADKLIALKNKQNKTKKKKLLDAMPERLKGTKIGIQQTTYLSKQYLMGITASLRFNNHVLSSTNVRTQLCLCVRECVLGICLTLAHAK